MKLEEPEDFLTDETEILSDTLVIDWETTLAEFEDFDFKNILIISDDEEEDYLKKNNTTGYLPKSELLDNGVLVTSPGHNRKTEEATWGDESDNNQVLKKAKNDLGSTKIPKKTKKKKYFKPKKEYECVGCKKVYAYPTSLLRHNNKHHTKRYVCQVCLKPFSRKPYLDRHLLKKNSYCGNQERQREMDQKFTITLRSKCGQLKNKSCDILPLYKKNKNA